MQTGCLAFTPSSYSPGPCGGRRPAVPRPRSHFINSYLSTFEIIQKIVDFIVGGANHLGKRTVFSANAGVATHASGFSPSR
jgi:hypothetical protein